MSHKPTGILVVGEEVRSATGLARRLEDCGFVVVGIAVGSEEARALLARGAPDLVMIDGAGTAAGLRAVQGVPVVCVAPPDDEAATRRACETERCAHLRQPFGDDELLAAIEVAQVRHDMEARLRQRERRFEATLGVIGDGVIAADAAGCVRDINPVAEGLTGWPRAEALGRPLREVLTLVDERSGTSVAALMDTPKAKPGCPMPRRAGRVVARRGGPATPVEYGAMPLADDDGRPVGAVLVLRDVGARRELERALAESEQRFEAAFAHPAIGMALAGMDGRLLQANAAVATMLGLESDTVPGLLLGDLCHEGDRAVLDRYFGRLAAGELSTFQVELRLATPDARDVWAQLSVSVVRGEGGRGLYHVVQMQDITARRAAEAQLVFVAYNDALTGLSNRAQINRQLEQMLALCRRRDEKLAVMFIGLDNFKLVNDTLGQRAGDALLREVGRRLRGTVREADVVGRIGGDEFVVILPGLEDDGAVAGVCAKLLAAMEPTCCVEGRPMQATCSIGVSRYPRDALTCDGLLAGADEAMGRAKEIGKNGYVFYSVEWGRERSERLLLEADLRRGLADGQFEIHYQPIHDAGGGIRSLEALLRWRHPDKGLLLPDVFMAIAERSGLIVPIGSWVLRSVCRQIRRWRDAGTATVAVAVNLSARQFRDAGLVATVMGALAESRLEAGCLELELTESSIMQQPERASAILDELRDNGLRIAVDDFGTGYSSLSYLKRFPIHALKIDRSFMTDLPDDRESSAIVSAIVTMSRALGLTVVGEGVENLEQARFLQGLGCDRLQGFLYQRPMPAAVIGGLLGAEAAVPSLAG